MFFRVSEACAPSFCPAFFLVINLLPGDLPFLLYMSSRSSKGKLSSVLPFRGPLYFRARIGGSYGLVLLFLLHGRERPHYKKKSFSDPLRSLQLEATPFFCHLDSSYSEVLFWSKFWSGSVSKSEDLISLETWLVRMPWSFPDIDVNKCMCLGQCSVTSPIEVLWKFKRR